MTPAFFAFGEELDKEEGFGSVSSLRFTGHERDRYEEGAVDAWEDDLDYMHARYHSPVWGRFVSVDPAGSADKREPQSWNRYSYVRNNPVRFVDPDGRVLETAWDALNVGLGAASLADNVGKGNYGAAALDGVGLAWDAVATAVPFLPGGASSFLKTRRLTLVRRLAENAARGRAFERAVLDTLGAAKNNLKVTKINGRVTTIPDILGGPLGVTDIKDVKKASLTKQLDSQLAAAETLEAPFNLILSTRTQTVSVPLQQQIRETGGRILIFDSSTDTLTEAVLRGNRIVRP